MTPTQREAALLLADELQRFDGAERESLRDEAAALLRELLAEPQGEPVGLDAVRQAIEERDDMERKYHDLAEHMVYHGNSVSWWHSKARAYGHSAQDTVHPMFLSAFISGYRAAERAHGITGEPT